MIFCFNANGDLLGKTPSKVYQGSNKASDIVFIAPIPATIEVSIAFTLPNGEIRPKRLMTTLEEPVGIEFADYKVSARRYDVLDAITAYAGEVGVQFSWTINGATIQTNGVSFTVEKGVPNFTVPADENSWDAIVGLLSNLQTAYQDADAEIENIKTEIGDDSTQDTIKGRIKALESEIVKDNESETSIVGRITNVENAIGTDETEGTVKGRIKALENFDIDLDLRTAMLEKDVGDLKPETERLKENATVNSNKLQFVENALVQSGTIFKSVGSLTEEIQQSGETGLEGLEIVDGSVAQVEKISGKSSFSKNYLKGVYVSGEGTKSTDGPITISSRLPLVFATIPDLAGLSLEGDGDNIKVEINTDRAETTEKSMSYNGEYKRYVCNLYRDNFEGNIVDITLRLKDSSTPATIKNIMLSTGIEYEPYWESAKNAKLSGIKSVGKNLINIDDLVGNALTKNADGTYTLTRSASGCFSAVANVLIPKGSHTLSAEIISKIGESDKYLSVQAGYENEASPSVTTWSILPTVGVQTKTYELPKNATTLRLYISSDAPEGYSITFKNLIIYNSAQESIMELPQEVELKEYDYIENGKLYQPTSEVYYFNGIEEWVYSESYNEYLFGFANIDGFRFKAKKADSIKTSCAISFVITGGNTSDGYGAFRPKTLPYTPKGTTAGEKLDEWKEYLSRNPFYAVFEKHGEYVNGNYKALDYSTEFVFDNEYRAWNNGGEQVVTPRDGDNKTCYNYGANATIENEYIVVLGGNE